jgi:hypothetical protein
LSPFTKGHTKSIWDLLESLPKCLLNDLMCPIYKMIWLRRKDNLSWVQEWSRWYIDGWVMVEWWSRWNDDAHHGWVMVEVRWWCTSWLSDGRGEMMMHIMVEWWSRWDDDAHHGWVMVEVMSLRRDVGAQHMRPFKRYIKYVWWTFTKVLFDIIKIFCPQIHHNGYDPPGDYTKKYMRSFRESTKMFIESLQRFNVDRVWAKCLFFWTKIIPS